MSSIRPLSPIESQLHRALIDAAVHRGYAVHDYIAHPSTDGIKLERWKFKRIALTMPTQELGRLLFFSVVPRKGVPVHNEPGHPLIAIFSQVATQQYRADLVMLMSGTLEPRLGGGRTTLLAIECDGHDWHERTKQQAAYDRARDRELLALGVPTIRFTGSEIVHDADRCAHEAVAVLAAIRDAWIHDFAAEYQYLHPEIETEGEPDGG